MVFQLLQSCVKFHLIPLQLLSDVVRPKLASLGDPRLLHLEESQRRYHLHQVQQAIAPSRHKDLRFADDVIARVHGRRNPANGFVGRGLEVYDAERNVWRQTSSRMNTNLVPSSATVVLDDFLYVAGGNNCEPSNRTSSVLENTNQTEGNV